MEQAGWTLCSKCQGLFFNGNQLPTACAAGGAHDPGGSGQYFLDMNADPGSHAHGQPDWAWCSKCQGLGYGPGFGSSACPAGGTHDRSGSANYTVDFVGDDTPPAEQQGWSWCHKCQGMFYASGLSAPCPAGDTHDNAGSGPYAIRMSAAVSLNTSPMIFRESMVLRSMFKPEPSFGPDQESLITADATAVVTDQNGTKWCTLTRWVGLPNAIGSADWECRRSQLTIRLSSAVPDAQVLPFSASPATASLVLRNGSAMSLTVVVDSAGVRLVTLFAGDDAGAASYDAAIGALSDPSGARVSLSCSHVLTIRVAAPTAPPIILPPIILDFPPVLRGPVLRNLHVEGAMKRRTLEPLAQLHFSQQLIQPNLKLSESPTVIEVSKRLAVERPDWGRVFVPPPAHGGETTHTVTVTRQEHGNLVFRPQTDEDAFPDIPRRETGGWLQVSRLESSTLHCLPDERPWLFYYLPTEYRLGFYTPDVTQEPDTPFRVSMARGDDAVTTITVTMTAMPYLSDADRSDLSTFLVQHELKGVPFVELRPASGLKAAFQADFLSDGQPVAMSSITYALAGTPTSDLLQIKFTMDQLDYGLLAVMLAKGITGEVVLSDDHIAVSVPVRMQLDKVITNAVSITQPPIPEPLPDPYTATVVLTNTLKYPVTLEAVQVSLVAVGSETKIVFEAERFDLLSAPLILDAGAASAPLTYTPTIPRWDTVRPVPGVVRVNGPAPAAWIDSVNRDPSLQPSKVSITLSPSVPAAHLDAIRAVTVAVYAVGDTSPWQPPVDIAPGHEASLELQLTLTQLAAGLNLRTGFFLEFTSRFADDTRSLPQRMGLDLTRKVLDLVVLWEPPGASYFVDSDTSIGPMTRDVAGQLIDTLRTVGKSWAVRAVAPSPP